MDGSNKNSGSQVKAFRDERARSTVYRAMRTVQPTKDPGQWATCDGREIQAQYLVGLKILNISNTLRETVRLETPRLTFLGRLRVICCGRQRCRALQEQPAIRCRGSPTIPTTAICHSGTENCRWPCSVQLLTVGDGLWVCRLHNQCY